MKRKKYLVRSFYVVDKKDNLVYIDTYRTLPNIEVEDELQTDKTTEYKKFIKNLLFIKRSYQENCFDDNNNVIGYFARDIYKSIKAF